MDYQAKRKAAKVPLREIAKAVGWSVGTISDLERTGVGSNRLKQALNDFWKKREAKVLNAVEAVAREKVPEKYQSAALREELGQTEKQGYAAAKLLARMDDLHRDFRLFLSRFESLEDEIRTKYGLSSDVKPGPDVEGLESSVFQKVLEDIHNKTPKEPKPSQPVAAQKPAVPPESSSEAPPVPPPKKHGDT